jgi:hypothetical protein
VGSGVWPSYAPIGIDVRLMEGSDFWRTQFEKTAHEAELLARAWRRKLIDVGWLE